MPEPVSPTTFRLNAEDRALLEAVAHATGRTLSAYVRDAALAAARGYLAREGIEKVLEKDKAVRAEQERSARRTADRKQALIRESVARVSPEDDPDDD